MKAHWVNDLRRSLTLFAGFAIGIHVAVLLHELGHALGCWLSGGTVTEFVMFAPMPAGYVRGHDCNRFMIVWGGVVFGSLSTLVPLALARRFVSRPVLRFVALMAAAFCFGHNALYLFVGSMAPFSDASHMIGLGASRWLLFLLSVPLLVGFVVVLSRAIQTLGLHPADSTWRWIVVVELGMLPVPVLMVIAMFFSTMSTEMRLSMSVLNITYIVCWALAAWRARSVAQSRGAEFIRFLMPQRWQVTAALFVGAFLLILVEWFAFRPA